MWAGAQPDQGAKAKGISINHTSVEDCFGCQYLPGELRPYPRLLYLDCIDCRACGRVCLSPSLSVAVDRNAILKIESRPQTQDKLGDHVSHAFPESPSSFFNKWSQ